MRTIDREQGAAILASDLSAQAGPYSSTMPSGAGLPRLKKYLLLASTRRWNDKTCSKACFSKSFRESCRGTRANRYSICSAGVGFAKGPRRTVAKISAERLLCRDRRAPPRLTTFAPGGQHTGLAGSRCASGRGGGRYRDHGLHEAALGVVANRA